LNPSNDHYQAINAFLQVLGPSLDSFRIRLQAINCPIRLHHNTHLRFLHLHVWRMFENETGLPSILSDVVSGHMEEISLDVLHFPNGGIFRDYVLMEWGDVDAILMGQQFSNLKSVAVRHIQYSPHGDDNGHPFEWFFDRLPLSYKRGILRLCEERKLGPYI